MTRPRHLRIRPVCAALGVALFASVASCVRAPLPPPEEPKPVAVKPSAPTPTARPFADCPVDTVQAGIAQLKAPPTAQSTQAVLEALDAAQSALMNGLARMSVAQRLCPDAAVRTQAAACERELSVLSVALGRDRALYDVLAGLDVSNLDAATRLWMARTLQSFKRNGVHLPPDEREHIQQLQDELLQLGQAFHRHIEQDNKTVAFEPGDLLGLPQDFLRTHAPASFRAKMLVSLNAADYLPVLTYAKRAQTREALWRAKRKQARRNVRVLDQLLAKRSELAAALGYPHWAAYALEPMSLHQDSEVEAFLDRLNDSSRARAKEDEALLFARKRRDVPSAKGLEPWDYLFYEDRLRHERLSFDSSTLRPYLEATAVQQGLMQTIETLFALKFEKQDAVSWHPDVEVYAVRDEDNTLRGFLYLDLWERADKTPGIAAAELTVGQKPGAAPEAILIASLKKPGGASPAQLGHAQVETLFHEMGHVLHSLLGGTSRWASLSGARVEPDMVEVPALLLQEWASEPSVLKTFAKRSGSGLEISEADLRRLSKSRDLGAALWTRKQLYFSAVGLYFHNQPPEFDTVELVERLQAQFEPFAPEHLAGTSFQTSLGLLESYHATYYSHLWARALAKDLLSAFTPERWLDPDTGTRFRKLFLEPGGAQPAIELYTQFLGHPPNTDGYAAFLNNVGLPRQ